LENVVIVSGVRTPIGDFGGSLSRLLPHQLGVIVVKDALKRCGLKNEMIDEVIMGCCLQRSDEPNLARMILLLAGIPFKSTGFTIQRQCASSMQALVSGAQEIMLGDAEIVITGGVESMSTAPYVLKDARWGARLQHGEMTDALWELLMDPIHKIMMGETAENLAKRYNISREEQDKLALLSHQRASKAIKEGKFKGEIVSVEIPQKKGSKIIIDTDEHPRESISMEQLSTLKAVFKKDGTVTAGNSSGLNDGAACLILMSERKAEALKIEPLVRIVSYAWAGVEPELMGYGPVPATRKALEKANMTLDDIELIELNEAFAAQYLACEKLLDLDRNITNVNGSGIALGHPVGCTGARIVITLINEMLRRKIKKGLATLCVGGGMGMALIIEQ